MKISKLETGLTGEISLPSDKSISHRSVILGAIASGKTYVRNVLLSEDVNRTIEAFRAMDVNIERKESDLLIQGSDFQFKKPEMPLDMGNSGTTTRLLQGVLAGQPFESRLFGDSSLSKRPMARVVAPLTEMGAEITYQGEEGRLPVTIKGKKELKAIDFEMPIASAQVKTAIILAALRAEGSSRILEKVQTRNHTEQMLPLFGGEIKVCKNELLIPAGQKLLGTELQVPGDISSAAFWMVAALIVPNSDILLKGVNVNFTRSGILDVLSAMEANFELLNVNEAEEIADIHVTYTANLQATTISGDLIPRLIDELPVIALLASQAEGETIIKDAEELRQKESDRIRTIVNMLSSLGVSITEREDGMIISGKSKLKGGKIDSQSDHRVAMTAAIAGLISKEGVEVLNSGTIATSYPDFKKDLEALCH